MTRPMNREGRKAIVPTHYPSICHVLQFKFIAMSGMPVFIRETCYVPYLLKSGGQYANLVPSCINAMCILDTRPKWTDGRYRNCVSEAMPKSDESVARRMLYQSRWEGHRIYWGCWKLTNGLTSTRVPDLNERACVRPTCEQSPMGWVLRMELGSVVIPWITFGGARLRPSHRMSGVSAPWCLKNTLETADAKLAVIQSHHVRHT